MREGLFMGGKSKIQILDGFYSDALNNFRDIYVYLPKSYEENLDKRYPVLYMHDGQNLFYGDKSLSRQSWDMHKTVDKLSQEGIIEEIIIVGISSNEDRWAELIHFEPEYENLGRLGKRPAYKSGEPKGVFYESFIVNEVKPFIDKYYRTLEDKENTALMGSSLGGLVTFTIGFRNPQVFGNLGIISPAFSVATEENFSLIRNEKLKLWIDCGEAEGHYMDNIREYVDRLIEVGFKPKKDLIYYEVPGAVHSEEAWAERVKAPLIYFFGNIGTPVNCEVYGRSTIGLKGMKVRLNPIVQFDSGFTMTDINAECIVENIDVLELEPNGAVIPKSLGKTNLIYRFGHNRSVKAINVVEEISEFVNISLKLKVPQNTPLEDSVTLMGGPLQRLDAATFVGSFQVPRDWMLSFRFTRGWIDKVEVSSTGASIPNRILKASEDMEVSYEVEKWIDL
jgi:predicted alpha/beta superfamily hydrolase